MKSIAMNSIEPPLFKDLEKELWTAADERRSNLDAAGYKHVVQEVLRKYGYPQALREQVAEQALALAELAHGDLV